jgi:hypothetical protein
VTYGYTWEQFWFEIPMDRLYAEQAWAMENDTIVRAFGGIHRDGPGYIGMEVKQLMAQIK